MRLGRADDGVCKVGRLRVCSVTALVDSWTGRSCWCGSSGGWAHSLGQRERVGWPGVGGAWRRARGG